MEKKLNEREIELARIIAEDTAMSKRALDIKEDIFNAPLVEKVGLCFNFSIGKSHCFRTIRISRGLAGEVLKFIEGWYEGDRAFAEEKFDNL